MSPGKRLNMRLRIAQERVRAGDLRTGIEEMQSVLAAVEAGQVPATEGFVYMLHDQLAIAYLRLGEQENCLQNHTTNSCLLPIRGDGIHTLQEGSRHAIEHYTINLNKRPSDLGTRWLLNLACMTLGEYPEGGARTLSHSPARIRRRQWRDPTLPRRGTGGRSRGCGPSGRQRGRGLRRRRSAGYRGLFVGTARSIALLPQRGQRHFHRGHDSGWAGRANRGA